MKSVVTTALKGAIAAVALSAAAATSWGRQPGGQTPANQPAASPPAQAPGGRGQPVPIPQTPQQEAPIDLTGWWVSVVTEDWRWRMVTPKKGDYASMPINDEGRKVADAWDPATDERDGNACRAYGAAAIMRVPARLHIAWQDQSTLRIDIDAGMQTRVLRFGRSQPPSDASWQGYSIATWEFLGVPIRAGGPPGGGFGGGGGGGGRGAAPSGRRYGSLKVATTRMKAGYLRRNGVPYSEDATVTEYFDRHREDNGDQWLTVTTIVDDPKYLTNSYITSSHFKKEPDGSKWRPAACSAQ